MEPPSTSSNASASLSAQSLAALSEGISLLISQWTVLQIAFRDEWGGRDCRQKSLQLTSDLLNWFAQSKGPLYIDDLEDLLDENMVLSFDAEIEDGSIEEIAEHLMIMHEECLRGNYESLENLRRQSGGMQTLSQSRQVVSDEGEGSEDEDTGMMVDEPSPNMEDTAVVESRSLESTESCRGMDCCIRVKPRQQTLKHCFLLYNLSTSVVII